LTVVVNEAGPVFPCQLCSVKYVLAKTLKSNHNPNQKGQFPNLDNWPPGWEPMHALRITSAQELSDFGILFTYRAYTSNMAACMFWRRWRVLYARHHFHLYRHCLAFPPAQRRRYIVSSHHWCFRDARYQETV